MSEWISVESELPDEWQRVIVCNINGEFNDWSDPISEAIFAPCGKGCCKPKFETKGMEYISGDEVTHWMPLPEPPK